MDRAALEADAIVNLPKLKAHRQALMTAAIKNMLDEIRVPDFDLPRQVPIGFSIPRFVKGSIRQAWLTHVAEKPA